MNPTNSAEAVQAGLREVSPVDDERSVLVVIPALNEAANIATVLRALGAESADASTTFVVADGGSTDGTAEIVADLMTTMPRLRLLRNPKRLQSAAVNLAVREFGAAARFLVRCDAHACYPPGYVRRLVESVVAHEADAVVVPMDSVGGDSCLGRAVAWLSDSLVGSGGSAHRGGRTSGWVDHGHHAAFRLERFRVVGGYDESFSHNEDAELDCRQAAFGSRLYLDAAIRIGYFPRTTWRGLARQYFSYGRGRARTVQRHPASIRPRQLAVPAAVAGCVVCLVLAAWWPVFLVVPATYLLALVLNASHLAIRKRAACALLAAPAAVCMHVGWAAGFVLGHLGVRESRWRPPDGVALAGAGARTGHSMNPGDGVR